MKYVFFFFAIIVPIVAMPVPISINISNTQSYIGISATPLTIDVGYPRSSFFFENLFGVNFYESTLVVNPYVFFHVYKYQNMHFLIGASSNFGKLPGASSGKIFEIGRNFLNLMMTFDFMTFHTFFEYSRFYSSVDYNSSEGILFLAPPNYSGESPNALSLFASYDLNWFKKSDVILKVYSNFQIYVSDTFLFSSPNFEIGISILTDTKNFM